MVKMSSVVGLVPEKYVPKVHEKEILAFFAKEKIRDKRNAQTKGGKKFYFLDGPPYVTNPVHVGTAWNKVIKDVVVRFKSMQGFHVRDQPGYDMHGLPIEVVVEKELGTKTKSDLEKKVGIKKFIDLCKRKSMKNLALQNDQFIDLGIWMDWDHPYMTIENGWIESVWWLIKSADEKGLLEVREKVVHWCPRCETVLSHHEVALEYKETKDPSIYVKFPVIGKKDTYILIWTTTPWTLPANLAVMVHPDEEYVTVRAGKDNLILARKRSSDVFGELGLRYEVLESYLGKDLEGLKYAYPLSKEVPKQTKFKEAHRVVLSEEYVSMEEGTGCVHSAPGHGEEDYEVGVREGLPIFSPVSDQGRFTTDAGRYKGLNIFDANEAVLKDLKAKGLLLFSGSILHMYPHCWRCKTKLVLRSTPQWFILVSKVRDRLVKENEKVNWVPKWAGEARFGKWLEGVRDWVISRQRYWGTPLPIWVCGSCGSRSVIGSIKELKKKAISLPRRLELHKPRIDGIKLRCECGGTMDRVPDLVDVWMDSGVASWACLGFPQKEEELKRWWPSDFITEGHDQTRGWFYTLLVSGVVAFDRSPFESVLMHGWTLDEGGVAMHKSLGNMILPGEVIEKFGRDALRWYVLRNTVWDDLRFSWSGVKASSAMLQIMWNVFHFATLYMNIDKFDPRKHDIKSLWSSLGIDDRWMVSRTESLKKSVTKHMENLNLHSAANDVARYLLNDLSRWYVKLVRRRFWEERESPRKIAAYATLYHALKNLLILSAPFTPFIVEKIYQEALRPVEGLESAHFLRWPKADEKLINRKLEKEMNIARGIVTAIFSARQKAGIKLRQPVAKAIIVADSPVVVDVTRRYDAILCSQANVKDVEVIGIEEERKLKEVTVIPRYGKLGPVFKRSTKQVAEALSATDGKLVAEGFARKGYFELKVGRRVVKVLPEHVGFKEEMPLTFFGGEFEGGRVYVDTRLADELIAEGMARDVVRRMQHMRKLLSLDVVEFVDAYIRVTPDTLATLKKFEDYLKQEVRIRNLTLLTRARPPWKSDIKEKWVLRDREFSIGIRRTAGS